MSQYARYIDQISRATSLEKIHEVVEQFSAAAKGTGGILYSGWAGDLRSHDIALELAASAGLPIIDEITSLGGHSIESLRSINDPQGLLDAVQSRFRDATEEGGLAKTLDASGKATPVLTEDFASTLGLDSSKFPSSAELRASGTELSLYDQYSASTPNIDANISDLTRSMHGGSICRRSAAQLPISIIQAPALPFTAPGSRMARGSFFSMMAGKTPQSLRPN
jgi:hypothetical protein